MRTAIHIALLRHAESTSSESGKADSILDSVLTEEGMEHAKELVSKLTELHPSVIYVSPLVRTMQTVQPYLDSLKVPIEIKVSTLLLERDLGEFTGTMVGDFQKYCDEHGLSRVSTRPTGGQSIADIYEKAELFLKELQTLPTDSTVLVCGHKNNLLCLQIALEGKNIDDYYFFESMKTGELRTFVL